jgi:hypothetical protein
MSEPRETDRKISNTFKVTHLIRPDGVEVPIEGTVAYSTPDLTYNDVSGMRIPVKSGLVASFEVSIATQYQKKPPRRSTTIEGEYTVKEPES